MTNSGKLKELLLYHTLRGRVSIAEALKQGKMKTILGPAVQFQQAGEEVFVNSAAVIERDIECTNGVLHLIDRVLVPPGFEFPREGSGQAGSPR